MRYQICVSGAHAVDALSQTHQLAGLLGKAIAERGKTLMTGATIGLPWDAAKAAFEVKGPHRGISVGFSPASSFREHVSTYKLPTKEFDYINFTGMEYVGRDMHLVRSSDAVMPELNVLGLRVHEALPQLEEFLDRATLNHQSSVRIIHGMGTGALRRAVRKFLADSPYCTSFNEASRTEGGGGATIVELTS